MAFPNNQQERDREVVVGSVLFNLALASGRFVWKDDHFVSVATGEIVKTAVVREGLERVILQAQSNMVNITLQLQEGTIDLLAWQNDIMAEIRTANSASGAAAGGGWAQMTQSDWGFVGSETKKQFKFLQGFVDDIASGRFPITGGRITARIRQYANAIRGTFEQMRRRFASQFRGDTLERRVLGQADHCVDCVELAGRGWQPIGTLPRLGQSVCRGNCYCHFEFKQNEESTSFSR